MLKKLLTKAVVAIRVLLLDTDCVGTVFTPVKEFPPVSVGQTDRTQFVVAVRIAVAVDIARIRGIAERNRAEPPVRATRVYNIKPFDYLTSFAFWYAPFNKLTSSNNKLIMLSKFLILTVSITRTIH